MKMRRLLRATLLASVLMTMVACGDSKEPGHDPNTPTPLPTDPNDPANATKDTDCDGLSDQVEFTTDRGNGRKTNPGLADTDGDGLPDGLELGIDTPGAGHQLQPAQGRERHAEDGPAQPGHAMVTA